MATFNVNTTSDIVDANDGVLSLREAIIAAEATAGRDTINLSGFVNLENPLFINAGNDLDISGNGRFTGIDGNNQTQLLLINGAEVRFDNLSLTEGRAQGGLGLRGAGGGGGFGGALFINGGDVTLDGVWLTNNQAIGGSSTRGRGDGGRGGDNSAGLLFRSGEDGQDGFSGGTGGTLNGLSNADLALLGLVGGGVAGIGGSGGEGRSTAFTLFPGETGGNGGVGGFGSGGGSAGGGGGGGGTNARPFDGGNGGNGGNGGFGGGAGGGGGGGGTGAGGFVNELARPGFGGQGGIGGTFGGNGRGGAGGQVGGESSEIRGAEGGAGGVGGIGGGGAGLGGAVFIREGSLTLVGDVSFENNSATGGTGFTNGQAKGGAVFILPDANAELVISGQSFSSANINFSGNTATDAENINNLDSENLFTTDNPNTFGRVRFEPPEPGDLNNPLLGLDVGAFSVPTFVDENGDGDLDLFIGASDGTIAVAHNQGTATNPNFADPIVIRDLGNRSTPTFVDIDGDGDRDLFAGDTFGRIHYYRNRGSVDGASFAAPIVNPFGLSGGGGILNPDFVDIDSDGDQDAFIGTANGTILFYANTGTRTNPNFVRSTNNPFGLQAVSGAAAPNFVDVGNDGDFDAFIGEANGRTRYFENVGTSTTPSFVERSLSVLNNPLPDVGSNATPVLVDINADGFLDAFIGEQDGTVRFVNAVVAGSEGETGIPDSLEAVSANLSQIRGLQPNNISGFDNSDDVLNGQEGNDIIDGLSGDDLLRGGEGNDILIGGSGADILVGGRGDDTLELGIDDDIDTVIYRNGDGSDIVDRFTQGVGGDLLSFEGIEAIDVVVNGDSTFFHLGDGVEGNAGFGSGQLLAELRGVSELTAENISQNLADSNTAQLLFG